MKKNRLIAAAICSIPIFILIYGCALNEFTRDIEASTAWGEDWIGPFLDKATLETNPTKAIWVGMTKKEILRKWGEPNEKKGNLTKSDLDNATEPFKYGCDNIWYYTVEIDRGGPYGKGYIKTYELYFSKDILNFLRTFNTAIIPQMEARLEARRNRLDEINKEIEKIDFSNNIDEKEARIIAEKYWLGMRASYSLPEKEITVIDKDPVWEVRINFGPHYVINTGEKLSDFIPICVHKITGDVKEGTRKFLHEEENYKLRNPVNSYDVKQRDETRLLPH